MNPYEYNLNFHVRHPDQDLTTIFRRLSEIVGIKPGRIWKAGDPRQTPKGTELDGYYSESFCSFGFFGAWQKSDQVSLPDVLENILEKLSPFEDMFKEFAQGGGMLEFVAAVGIDSNSGIIFPRHLLKKLVDLQIELAFDLYPPGKTT